MPGGSDSNCPKDTFKRATYYIWTNMFKDKNMSPRFRPTTPGSRLYCLPDLDWAVKTNMTKKHNPKHGQDRERGSRTDEYLTFTRLAATGEYPAFQRNGKTNHNWTHTKGATATRGAAPSNSTTVRKIWHFLGTSETGVKATIMTPEMYSSKCT